MLGELSTTSKCVSKEYPQRGVATVELYIECEKIKVKRSSEYFIVILPF